MACLVVLCWVVTSLLVTQVKSSTYYISPSPNNHDWCSDINSCFSLSEIATLLSTANISDSNISLILAPGNHSLNTNLTVYQIACFTMVSEDNDCYSTSINCNGKSKFAFHSIQDVHIQGIGFSGCLGNSVTTVDEFIIEDSTFSMANIDIQNLYINSDRILFITRSNVIIMHTIFQGYNIITSKQVVGAISCSQSSAIISNSDFVENVAEKGGALNSIDSKVLISNCSFRNNRARHGGVLHIVIINAVPPETNVSQFSNKWFSVISLQRKNTELEGEINIIVGSIFSENIAIVSGGVIYSYDLTMPKLNSLYVFRSSFINNFAKFGGVFRIKSFHVAIHNSSFLNNVAHQSGGVGNFIKGTIKIVRSVLNNNKALISAGALGFKLVSNSTIDDVRFCNNTAHESGGSLGLIRSKLQLTGSVEFQYNSAKFGGTLFIQQSSMMCNGSLTISNDNGPPIHVLQSELVISGNVRIRNNTAINGGGILSISSKTVLDKTGRLEVTDNVALDTGGGIYLYYSELHTKGKISVYRNKAKTFGGGIHCVNSEIIVIRNEKKTWNNGRIRLKNNSAYSGGGIYLEDNSKIHITRFKLQWLNLGDFIASVEFFNNRAQFGGAIFVADNTTSGTCAASGHKVQAISQSECFMQLTADSVLKHTLKKHMNDVIGNIFVFSNNTANTSGSFLYGGLLDRCTLNGPMESIRYSNTPNSFNSILNNTSSDPVRVCICNPNSDTANCSFIPKNQHYKKGSNLTLRVAAIDQVNHVVPATIYGSLQSKRGHLGDHQLTQRINAICTDLNFTIFSPLNESDQLILYAKGPCNSLGISSLRIEIEFAPCWCPVGFEPDEKIIDNCVCSCHSTLKNIFPFIEDSDCNSESLLLARHSDFWITAANLTNTNFISYQHCPSPYCHPSTFPVYIDFNNPNGADVQCAFNRTGIICGKCQPNLTLSLGSPRCIKCPSLWPLITVGVSIGAFIAGLVLVALILVLNLTVARGTLNAMIFYANVLAIKQQQFVPQFKHPNFHTVFISWLNLDVGFDICFCDGLDAYTKAWLQLIFPVYIILVVIAVIILSQYSRRFSHLIARKNPVATLATLILLSYAKLLHSIIVILSPANLRYTPVDKHLPTFTKIVWLHDGSIAYLGSKHIPLFLIAILIVILGFVYTLLLLSWQWLVKFSNKRGFCWVRNTKLSSFMDAYHAPYTARNRYWTGLLLLARVILYFTAAMNISGEPSVNLLVISLVIGSIFLLHVISGISVYRKWTLNIFEFVTFFNILAFVVSKLYIQIVGGSDIAVAYISISAQIVIFVCSLLHHFVVELLYKIKPNCKRFKNYFIHQNLQIPLLDTQYAPPSRGQTVTTTEVSIKKPGILLKMNSANDDNSYSERKELTELLEIETHS